MHTSKYEWQINVEYSVLVPFEMASFPDSIKSCENQAPSYIFPD